MVIKEGIVFDIRKMEEAGAHREADSSHGLSLFDSGAAEPVNSSAMT
jgi:hypothetical protein